MLDSYQGNPIRVATGEKYEAEVDYVGKGGMPLQIRRSYHSRELGWHFSTGSRLEFISDGQYDFIQWINGQGFTVSFTMIDGTWISKSNPSLRLWKQGDRHWRLRDDQQNVYIFSDTGLLQIASNTKGDTQEFFYDIGDRVTRIDSSDEDFLTFEYDSSGLLIKIVNAANESFEYSYNQSQIIEVKYPVGSSKIYHYENVNFPTALTGVTDENGIRYVTWEYDEEGRAVSSEHDNGVDRTEFIFNQDGSTTVTNSLQKTTTYHYSLINNEKKLIRIEGHISQNCEASNAYNSYYIDGTLQTRSDRNGNVILYERDNLGREIRKTSGLNWSGNPQYGYNIDTSLLVNTPVTKIEEYCWHPAFPQIVKTIKYGSVTKASLNQQGLLVHSTTEPRTQNNENCDDVPTTEAIVDDLPDDWEWIHFGSVNQDNDGDFDNDGISNFQELFYGLDPSGGPDDSDQDGMLDGWEFHYFGDLEQSGTDDYDGDGETNYQEHVDARNPSANDNFNYLDRINSNGSLVFSEFNTRVSGGQINQWFTSFGKYALGAEQKHYWEVELHGEHALVGIGSDVPLTSYPGSNSDSYGWWSQQGVIYHGNQATPFLDYGPGDVLMFAYDSVAGKLWFGKNGEWQGDPSAETAPAYSNITGIQYPVVSLSGTNASVSVKFDPAQFHYATPTNYLRLDSDLDGLYDQWELENFGNLSQSSEDDFDSDGVINGNELKFGLDPTDGNSDSDQDALSDAWEMQYFNNLSRNGSGDFDGDGISDSHEFLGGTDPLMHVRRNYLDPNNTLTGLVLSNQNRVVAAQYSRDRWRSSIAKSALGAGQKYYWEVGGSGNRVIAGVASNIELVQHFYAGSTSSSYGSVNLDGNIFNNGLSSGAAVGGYENGRLMIAYDPDAGKLWFGRDGIWQGDPSAGTEAHFSNLSGLMYPVVSIYSAGQASIYFQSSEFLYSPPEGFEASLLYDVDEDGLSDNWELEFFGNLSQLAESDFDEDGISNLQEFDLELNPTDGNPDSDADGLTDAWEAQYFGTLVFDGSGDFDGDGINNRFEFELSLNPATVTINSDGDTLPDFWELRYFGSFAQQGGGDFDQDGVSNYQEYIRGTNPLSAADGIDSATAYKNIPATSHHMINNF
ncbi:hypothetical protein NBRC116493_35880 [Aurantivibrio infirmus]